MFAGNKTSRVFILLVFMLSLTSLPGEAALYRAKGARPETSYLVYIPDKLDRKKRHPWILGLSPDADSAATLNAMQQGCDESGWILVASDNSRNGMPYNVLEQIISDTINSAVRTLPVDPSRMYVGGLSGGSMTAHWLAQKHSAQVRGLVINCGMINREDHSSGYPSGEGRPVVFMTNPQDFRYNEIRSDYQRLHSLGWNASWMEFSGGHAWAPPEFFSAAFKWVSKNTKLPKPVPAAQAPVSLDTLKKQLAAAQAAPAPDQQKVAGLIELIADSQANSKQWADAESSYRQALDINEKLTEASPASGRLMKKLAVIYSAEGKNADSADLLQKALQIYEKSTDEAAQMEVMELCAKALYRNNQAAEADALYARLKDLKAKH